MRIPWQLFETERLSCVGDSGGVILWAAHHQRSKSACRIDSDCANEARGDGLLSVLRNLASRIRTVTSMGISFGHGIQAFACTSTQIARQGMPDAKALSSAYPELHCVPPSLINDY